MTESRVLQKHVESLGRSLGGKLSEIVIQINSEVSGLHLKTFALSKYEVNTNVRNFAVSIVI